MKMTGFLYKRKVRKHIFLRTRYLNLLQGVKGVEVFIHISLPKMVII